MTSASAALTGSYDYSEVARSVLIAIFASYAALDLAGRVTAARGRVRLAWLSGGAIAMGIGIWAMHVKGMLAFHLPVPVAYYWPTVLVAVSLASFASAVALYVTSRQKMGRIEAMTGSIVMAAGIAGLHYVMMDAMRLPAITQYSPFLVACSILLGILFSLIALLLAFGLREETRWSVPRRLGSATAMGAAVSAMHYTGMAAASFFPTSPPDLSHAMSVSPIGSYGVVIVTLVLLVGATVTSSVDRRQSEEHLRRVVDTIPQQIWSTPSDGLLDFCNAQFRGYVGLALEELQDEGWQPIVHPDDRERVVKAWRESVTNGMPFEQEARHRRADGQYCCFLVRGVPLRDPEGHIVRWYGTSTDIEDRKRAEVELKASEAKYRVIVEAASDAVISMDENGGILLANPATARIFGYDPAELIGKPLTILMPEFMRKLHEAVQTLFGDRPTASQLARDRSYCPAQEWAGVSGGGVFRRNDQ
jgi:PAS domain S-box-containing protein